MPELDLLQPERIWKWFLQLCTFPRASGNEAGVIAWIKSIAEAKGMVARTDKAGNLVVYKKAADGYTNMPVVVLQAHVDMVCEKNKDIPHNFERDPIKPYIDSGWLKAQGTTLGADNGIGVAVMLAIMEDEQLQHGPLELLFTVDEERGLTGARNLDQQLLKGKILINLDSEDEGELFIGCAGGIDTIARFIPVYEPVPKGCDSFAVAISGLTGGHSGDEIDKGHANSIKLLARFLAYQMQPFDLRISSFSGGHQHNAIPREAHAVICLPSDRKETFIAELDKWHRIFTKEYAETDPHLKFSITESDEPEHVFATAFQYSFIHALNACPSGVQRMSRTMPGLVETSTNLASLKQSGWEIVVATSQRSAVDSAKNDIANQVASVFHLAGANVEHSTGYPGWEPKPDSKLVKHVAATYTRLFNKIPTVRAIHAGLECGLFLEKFPDLDMISFGPTIKGVHSPDERVNIESVEKFWVFLLEVLKTMPAV